MQNVEDCFRNYWRRSGQWRFEKKKEEKGCCCWGEFGKGVLVQVKKKVGFANLILIRSGSIRVWWSPKNLGRQENSHLPNHTIASPSIPLWSHSPPKPSQ
jgi:hypothetical protein